MTRIRRGLSLERIEIICDFLGVPFCKLFEEEQKKDENDILEEFLEYRRFKKTIEKKRLKEEG